MQVRLTTDRAGYGWEQHQGEVVDLPRKEALRLIQCGQAEPIERPAPVSQQQRSHNRR